MTITRREFITRTAAMTAAATAGITLEAGASNVVTDALKTQLTWNKAPCRFCGVGCGVNVGVKDGRVVATHGDIGPLRRGAAAVVHHAVADQQVVVRSLGAWLQR